MRTTIRKFLHDEIAELLSLPKNKVIWAYQEGPQPAAPFVVLQSFAEIAEAYAEHLPTVTPGEIELRTPTAFTLEVQYFGKKASRPVDVLYDLVRNFERPTVIDAFAAAGVAFLYAEAVQDVTAMMENTQQTEPRATVDLHLRYTASVNDTPGIIEQVIITSEVAENNSGPEDDGNNTPDGNNNGNGSEVDYINKLIYGHIDEDGVVTDVERAIPVNIEINND